MAGTIMHLVIADQLLEQLGIQNPGYFYCGNLAPDAIMNRKNFVREMKRHTHFKDGIRLHELRIPENFKVYLERLNTFYQTLVAVPDPHHEIYFGYLTHMLVDELYVLHFRDDFVDRIVAEGMEPTDEEFFRIYTKDVYLVDLELVRTYDFHYPMPETLRIKESYEIPGLVTAQELLDSKEFIINMNFGKAGARKKPHAEDAPLSGERPHAEDAPFSGEQPHAEDAPFSGEQPRTEDAPVIKVRLSMEEVCEVKKEQSALDAPCSEDEIKKFYFPDISDQFSKELKVMTMQQNLDFIELCVREVPRILRERYGLCF